MKIIVAVTGASGAIYAQRLLEKLQQQTSCIEEIAVIFSDTAKEVWKYEIGENLVSSRFVEYANNDFFSPVASGSAQYDAMIVCPCSAGTMGRIANGTADNLIARAADVMLKERRRLILVLRETPYNLIHIKNMETITLAGGIICPASPSFYSKPSSIAEVCDTVVDRVLDLVGLPVDCKRWGSKE